LNYALPRDSDCDPVASPTLRHQSGLTTCSHNPPRLPMWVAPASYFVATEHQPLLAAVSASLQSLVMATPSGHLAIIEDVEVALFTLTLVVGKHCSELKHESEIVADSPSLRDASFVEPIYEGDVSLVVAARNLEAAKRSRGPVTGAHAVLHDASRPRRSQPVRPSCQHVHVALLNSKIRGVPSMPFGRPGASA
jgi:hypothetical protein